MENKQEQLTVGDVQKQFVRAMVLIWIVGGSAFGLWQNSAWAGLYMFVFMAMISRKI